MVNIDNDVLKKSFNKIKEDMFYLKEEIESIKSIHQEIYNLKESNNILRDELINLSKILMNLNSGLNSLASFKEELTEKMNEFENNFSKQQPLKEYEGSSDKIKIPTVHHINQIYPAHIMTLKPLKSQNMYFSTGNQGVPADRQTNRQTNRQTQNEAPASPEQPKKLNVNDSFKNASEIYDSLDNIKKEIRLKFKRLTDQEILVFSTIYQLEEDKGYTDYQQVSSKLNLTESSIRDYVSKIIKKGIPLDKKKINNKSVNLSISPNLKKIASLSTILELRDI